jgi:hypothetical protein
VLKENFGENARTRKSAKPPDAHTDATNVMHDDKSALKTEVGAAYGEL